MSAATTVTFQGNPLVLAGTDVCIGDAVPAFTVLSNDLAPVTQEVLKGKTTVIITVPSLDTPVCDLETRRFNKEATALGSQVQVLCISTDLPFAQARWCGASNVMNVRALSDHRELSFGLACGVVLKELRLLTRAVFIVDAGGVLRYKQIVPEITSEPDYGAVLLTVRKML